MVMRLAFSVAVHVDPDILLIDEVLAVGDQEFQKKCFERINMFRQQGKTLLFVSHAAEMLKSICHRGIWLEHGRVRMDGPLSDVLAAYQHQLSGRS
jgi:ABC-type polysaccharide/polyol phosphate transport system ATPase subunit